MGTEAVATWLNERGYRTRKGGMWGNGTIHQLLTNPVYGGRWRFNHVDSKTRREKADAEQIFADAPAIIAPDVFAGVQRLLKGRNPCIAAPRSITGPILLTGLAFCNLCQGAMSLRTGTSKTGKVHRYYACSTSARKGKKACPGRTVQMDRLDHLVTKHLMDKLLTGDRIWELLSTLATRRAERAATVDARLTALEREVANAEEKLKRLYKLIEDGVAEMDDLLKERITALRGDRDRSKEALARARGNVKAKAEVTEEAVAKFSELMRQRIQEGDMPARKAWLTSIIDRIEVDAGTIRLFGRKDVLEQCIIAGTATTPTASSHFCSGVARPEGFEPPTPRFVVWCSIQLSYGRMPMAAQTRPLLSGCASQTPTRSLVSTQCVSPSDALSALSCDCKRFE